MPDEPHILVAEDEASLRLLFGATLKRIGARVSEAHDGAQVLDLVERDRPDLILLDVGLPKIDGYTVCQTLKSKPATADVVIVLVTARAQPSDRAEGLAHGANDYLTKPFSPARLIEVVRRCLGNDAEH
jgi:two-component system alkaline phosphatase synthesis response regulator PhoP